MAVLIFSAYFLLLFMSAFFTSFTLTLLLGLAFYRPNNEPTLVIDTSNLEGVEECLMASTIEATQEN